MDNTAKNQPLPPDLAQQRQQLADALGFLLAQAWLREHRQPTRPVSKEPPTGDGIKYPP